MKVAFTPSRLRRQPRGACGLHFVPSGDLSGFPSFCERPAPVAPAAAGRIYLRYPPPKSSSSGGGLCRFAPMRMLFLCSMSFCYGALLTAESVGQLLALISLIGPGPVRAVIDHAEPFDASSRLEFKCPFVCVFMPCYNNVFSNSLCNRMLCICPAVLGMQDNLIKR